jgi:methylated-DNA-[protein]-cysteine S-methyltransferase
MIHLHVVTLEGPVGPIWIAGTDGGVLRLGFGPAPELPIVKALARARVLDVHNTAGPMRAAVRSLRSYWDGRIGTPSAALDLGRQSPFQRRIWEIVRRIPPGQLLSFATVARSAGVPRAARAVGQALATNPVPLFVPCHRVVLKGGDLAGYVGGTTWKRFLLEHESAQMRLGPMRGRRSGGRARST